MQVCIPLRALQLRADGVPFGDICRDLGLPRRTIGNWLHGERARRRAEREAHPSRCARCVDPAQLPGDPVAYVYLLGLYLRDGHLVTSTRVPVLRVYCTANWPGLIDACRDAMLQVLARKSPHGAESRLCRRAKLLESLAMLAASIRTRQGT
jgi:hypothetical protein